MMLRMFLLLSVMVAIVTTIIVLRSNRPIPLREAIVLPEGGVACWAQVEDGHRPMLVNSVEIKPESIAITFAPTADGGYCAVKFPRKDPK